MNLHLFCMPGTYPLQNIVAASKPHLAMQSQPTIVYIPAADASLRLDYVDQTRIAFKDFAEVEILDLTKSILLADLESSLEKAIVLYIPGGNTYILLSHLYQSGAFFLIQELVKVGIPLMGFSAGMAGKGEPQCPLYPT